MADPLPSRDLSLVPYSINDRNSIILRHNNAVVVYDPASRQLVLRGTPSSSSIDLASSSCPYCHRPLAEASHDRDAPQRDAAENVEANFVSPEYFRRLQTYPNGPVDRASPPSPRRRLAQPIEAGERTTSRQASHVEPAAGPSTPSPTPGISSAAFCQDYFQRFFVEQSVLGKGGKGVVLLVKHYLDGVFLGDFACKRVPVGDDHEWLKKVLVEVVLLQQLSHQNLVSYRHVWLEDVQLTTFGPSVPCAFILQQYCNTGDLLQYVCRPTTPATTEQRKNEYRRRSHGHRDRAEEVTHLRGLSFDEIYSFFKDITSGLSYLHRNGFIHRDLKPSNCLLHKTGTDVRVLVSDFGEAQEASKGRTSSGATGTISYCAPEVLRQDPSGGQLGDFTDKSDIFSLGMILYFMCFSRLPYTNADNLHEENEDLEQLRDEISAWRGFEDETRARSDLPDQLYRFLKRLLSAEPAARPSAEDILRGISTGTGVGDGLPAHHGNSSSVFEDIRTGPRISSLDTPPPGTPVGHWQGRRTSNTTGLVRPGSSKLRPLTLGPDLTDTIPSDERTSDTEDPSVASSLVLRKKHPSPIPTTHPSPRHAPTTLSRLRSSLHHTLPSAHNMLQAVLIMTKVFSMQQACAPFAVSTPIFYSLLGLAVLDLALRGWHRGLTLLLALVHVIVLFCAGHWEVLCRSTAHWRDD